MIVSGPITRSPPRLSAFASAAATSSTKVTWPVVAVRRSADSAPDAHAVRAHVGGAIDGLVAHRVIGVGRIACDALGKRALYVRHPAQSGATAFRSGMRQILTR